MPAPPPESDPAIVKAMGIAILPPLAGSQVGLSLAVLGITHGAHLLVLELQPFARDLKRHPIDRVFRGKHLHNAQLAASVAETKLDDIVVVLAQHRLGLRILQVATDTTQACDTLLHG